MRSIISVALVMLAAVAVGGEVVLGDAATCPPTTTKLPCILQHGCNCSSGTEHASTVVGPDGQTYGACTNCGDGWSGPTCATAIATCLNGGTLRVDPDGTKSCHCPPGWAGDDCSDRRCVQHQPDGGVSNQIRPSADTNMCAGLCDLGFGGPTCDTCTLDSACGTDKACDKSLLPLVPATAAETATKRLECTVNKSPLLHLLGGGRDVGGEASFQCHFDGSDARGSTPNSNGQQQDLVAKRCDLQFFRVEPNRTWLDAFFFCELANCTATTHIAAGMEPSWASIPGRESGSRAAARLLVLAAALVIALNHVFLPAPTPTKRRVLKGASVVLVGVLVVVVLLFGLDLNPVRWRLLQRVMHWNSTATGAVAKVLYTCESSICTCANTAASGTKGAQYTPHCIGSMFGEHILPGLTHGAKIDCDATTGACTFDQTDLNSPIALQCSSGDCVNASSTRGSGQHDDERLVPGGTVKSKPPTRTDQRKTTEAFAFVLGVGLLCGTLLHWLWSRRKATAAKVAFRQKYLSPADAPPPPSVPPSPTDSNDDVTASREALEDMPRHQTGTSTAAVGGAWRLAVEDLCYRVPAPAVADDDDLSGTSDDDEDDAQKEQRRLQRKSLTRLRLRRRGYKAVLDHVSFDAHPGELLALMGTSGAGKTSLLDVLAARDKAGTLSGRMTIAGEHLLNAPATRPVPARTASAGWLSTALVRFDGVAKPWLPGGSAWAGRRGAGMGRQARRTSPGRLRRSDVHDTSSSSATSPTLPRAPTSFDDAVSREVHVEGSAEIDAAAAPPHPAALTFTYSQRAAERVAQASRVQQYRRVVGYVAQEDTLIPTLTVRQSLRVAAQLRLPAALSSAAIANVVEQAIDALGLRGCADTMVGGAAGVRGLSGGERRRVSIGVELVGLPRVLFLDEPTSGLDSENARRVIECVSALTHGVVERTDRDEDAAPMPSAPSPPFSPAALESAVGRWAGGARPIVIVSIHQPSKEIFDVFDKVLLLNAGRVVYHGPAAGSVDELRRAVHGVEAADDAAAEERQASLDNDALGTDPHVRGSYLFPGPGDDDNDCLPASNSAADRAERKRRRQRLLRREWANPAEFLLAFSAGLDVRDVTAVADTRTAGLQAARRRGEGIVAGGEIGLLTQLADEKKAFGSHVWRQCRVLAKRSAWSLFGAYHLIAAHAGVAFAVGLMLSELYQAEPLSLPGTLNRAGSLAFLQLFLAFSSLSCLEVAVAERKLIALEMEASSYGAFPVVATRLLFDVVPLRIVPTAVVASIIYAPMGLRVDEGGYFAWYMLVLTLFSSVTALTTYCTGLLCPSLGSAALLSAVVTLWNFVFGGLLVQPGTIPPLLKPFRTLSPFFLSYEALLVNELDGQTCTFAPADASGRPASDAIPLYCTQYLYNMGLDPSAFAGDVALLAGWAVALVALSWILVARLRFVR